MDGNTSVASRANEMPVAAQVVLRPLSNPLPMGFSALVVAMLLISGLQLRWVPAAQQHHIAMALLAFAVPLQLLACLFGFAARDVAASTGMGLLAATTAAIGVEQVSSPPYQISTGLGLLLIIASVALVVPTAGAAITKLAPAAAIALAALRFAATGVYEMSASPPWRIAAGILGCVAAAAAFYTALAAELEGVRHRPILPLGRRGRSRWLSDGGVHRQLADVQYEPGVRQQL